MSPPSEYYPKPQDKPHINTFVIEDDESKAFWRLFSTAVEEGQGLLRDNELYNPLIETSSRVDWFMERTFIETVCLPLMEAYWMFQHAFWYPLELAPIIVQYAIALQGSMGLIKTKTVEGTKYFMVDEGFLYRVTGVPKTKTDS